MEELFEKYIQGTLTEEESAELKVLLRDDPEAGKKFSDYIKETSLMIQVASQLESASGKYRISIPGLTDKEKEKKRIHPVFRKLMLAAAACILIVAGVHFVNLQIDKGTSDLLRAKIMEYSDDIKLMRDGVEIEKTPGMDLHMDDTFLTGPEGKAEVQYNLEKTLISIRGKTEVTLSEYEGAKRIAISSGTIKCEVAPQPAEKRMLLTTPHVEAEVLGTTFTLSVTSHGPDDTLNTRLEVDEGEVKLSSLSTEEAINVKAGQYAYAGPDTDMKLFKKSETLPVKPFIADEKAPLGSADFYPSPERPIGWRGDGSGRFPGAAPPKTWDRRLTDITSEIIVQASRPEGKPGTDSQALEYFTVKDWLITGPYPAPDPEEDIDNDFLGEEAEVRPDTGNQAGSRLWLKYRAYEGSQSFRNLNEGTSTHLYVDFVHAFGKLVPPEEPGNRKDSQYNNLDKQAAYAHTYLYAPVEADVYVDIIHRLPAVRMWVNGTPQRMEKGNARSMKVHLKKGWNRILVKAVCDKAQMPWRHPNASPHGVLGQTLFRFAMYIRAADPGPFSYRTKNIAWMTKLTGRNGSQSITVGDRLFVGSGDTDLFCLDKQTGKIEWMHTMTYRDVMTDEEWAAVRDKAAPLLEELDKANRGIAGLLNANISPQGLDTDTQAAIDKKVDERNRLVRSVHRSLAAGKKGRLYDNYVSAGNATPTSDGRYVYWVVQGNGGYLVSAFDLYGKRVWSSFDYQGSVGREGSHRSPLLCEGKLLVSTDVHLIAYDAATGRELWRTPGVPHEHGINGTPIPVQINGRTALQTAANLVSLDGEILSENGYSTWGCYLPVVEGGFLYNSCISKVDYTFQALAIPIQKKSAANWKLDPKTLYGQLVNNTMFFYNASPLYVNGLLYQVDMSGILTVIDTRERKQVYQRFMDGYNYNDRGLYGYCSSPTLAGKNIYFLDGVGYTTIIKPGADCTVIGNNMLQNLSNMKNSAPGRQEGFYSNMYFHGRQIFIHSDNYLYCIQEGK